MRSPRARRRPADLEPVEPRHQDVEHDQVGIELGRSAQTLRPIGRERDVESPKLERAFERSAHWRLVVDDQQLPSVEISQCLRHLAHCVERW